MSVQSVGASPAAEPRAPGDLGRSGPQRRTGATTGSEQLSEEDRRTVQKMAARDREVRAHEMAHVAAGGAHVTGGPSYSYQTGPDGKRYAVGGEVGIDTSPEKDPRATIAKMIQVRAAALAPAEPSGADRAVAAAASQQAAEARAALSAEEISGADGERGRDDDALSDSGAPSTHRHASGAACPGCVGDRYDQSSPAVTPATVERHT